MTYTNTGAVYHVEPHGYCAVVQEHGQEWVVCKTCGAQWALHGDDLETVSEGDGYCLEHADDKPESATKQESFFLLVMAPMDQVYIGPFATKEAADAYAKPILAKNHDAYLMTESEMLTSQKVYGEIPVQEPN